ncbi:1488_t:CDS:1 [Cetraspora pellucida]|uniref:1488_t:CDS:1 n=1 Tax=Cetraspora pellucida TaxID=1433469 RepID=A0ACA9L8M6_9GLOM|nr:1488_t:CDS:1 [Cetraspora pellucida]
MTQVTKRSKLHYYSDGDIILIVDKTIFLLHKTIIGLASKVFQDMFSCASTFTSEIPEITLEDVSPIIFEELISYIYPDTYISINWNNVSEFLRIADKYIMESILMAAKAFLEREFRKNPLPALRMAERYEFKELYKESSKLILEKFPDYKRSQTFNQLSVETRNALISKYDEYTNALSKLSKIDFTSGFLHCNECKSPSEHDKKINEKFDRRVRQLQILPLPVPPTQPSITRKILFEAFGNNMCDKQFMDFQLPRKFKKHFGCFEPLDCKKHKKDKKDQKYYLFIELP